jgi:gluconate 2-dehydrogenase gamma chain
MQRRQLLKIGATLAAFPAVIPEAWAQQAAQPQWKPAILSAHENETAIVLTELIIPATDTPGAKLARVNRYIDLFLRDGSLEQRDRILGGLAWLDRHAMELHGRAFLKCSPEEQVAMLKALDHGQGIGHTFFRQMKSLTANIYYATEIGVKELNKGGRVPASFGCQHASHG